MIHIPVSSVLQLFFFPAASSSLRSQTEPVRLLFRFLLERRLQALGVPHVVKPTLKQSVAMLLAYLFAKLEEKSHIDFEKAQHSPRKTVKDSVSRDRTSRSCRPSPWGTKEAVIRPQRTETSAPAERYLSASQNFRQTAQHFCHSSSLSCALHLLESRPTRCLLAGKKSPQALLRQWYRDSELAKQKRAVPETSHSSRLQRL